MKENRDLWIYCAGFGRYSVFETIDLAKEHLRNSARLEKNLIRVREVDEKALEAAYNKGVKDEREQIRKDILEFAHECVDTGVGEALKYYASNKVLCAKEQPHN